MKKKITAEQAEQAAKDWTEADIQLSKAQNEKRLKTTPIIHKYAAMETEHSDKKKEAEAILEAYANQQREILFEDGKKSTPFAGAIIGFKTSPAKLVSTDWDKSLKLLNESNPEFIIEKMEIDKKGILRNADNFDPEDLETLCLSISREEKFYVKA